MCSRSNNEQPEVSIIVPIFNVEQLLPRCVESIIGQDFDSYEVLLIDDGSTDSSGKIAEKYARHYDNIKCYHKANGGLSDARNYGIDQARGSYYAFIDSDDYISRSFVSSLYEALKSSDADIAVCDYQIVPHGHLKVDAAVKTIGIVKSGDEALRSFFSYQRIIDVVAWNKLYRAELFADAVRYPVGKINEDVWTTYKLFSRSKRIVYIDQKLYFYFQRSESIMHSFSQDSLGVVDVALDARRWLGSEAHRYKIEIDWFELRLVYRTLCRLLDNGVCKNRREINRFAGQITARRLASNPCGSTVDKILMWLTAHMPKIMSVIRSFRTIS